MTFSRYPKTHCLFDTLFDFGSAIPTNRQKPVVYDDSVNTDRLTLQT